MLISMVRARSASWPWAAHVVALRPVAGCDELTDDINTVTQLNKNAHRLNLRQKTRSSELMSAMPCPTGLMKRFSFPNILMKTLTIKDE